MSFSILSGSDKNKHHVYLFFQLDIPVDLVDIDALRVVTNEVFTEIIR